MFPEYNSILINIGTFCKVDIIIIHVLKLKKLCLRITEVPTLSHQWHQDSNQACLQ